MWTIFSEVWVGPAGAGQQGLGQAGGLENILTKAGDTVLDLLDRGRRGRRQREGQEMGSGWLSPRHSMED